MGKVNGSGTCWDKYSGGEGNMSREDRVLFWHNEVMARSDYGNISYQEHEEMDGLWDNLIRDGVWDENDFNLIVNLTNRHLASGEGGSSGGGSSGGGGGGNNAEQMKHKIRNTKEYHRLDRGEKNRVLQEMDKRASGGISQSEYDDVFNNYVKPYD